VIRGRLRLLLSGLRSSAGRPIPDGRRPGPGGWNRIHFVVDDIAADVARLRAAGIPFRNEIISGPGGQQVLLEDPSGNPIELFQPANAYTARSTAAFVLWIRALETDSGAALLIARSVGRTRSTTRVPGT